MDEMLKRQDVIAALSAAIDETEEHDVILGLEAAISIIKQMQTAPVGAWRIDIDKSRDLFDWRRFYCPACGRWQTYGESEYCPLCGARVMSKQIRQKVREYEYTRVV